jgi:hypothetical protein
VDEQRYADERADMQRSQGEAAEKQEMLMLLPGVEAGDESAIKTAIGRIAAKNPAAAQTFLADPSRLAPAMRNVLGIQQPAAPDPAPVSERVGEFDVLMQGDKVIGHRGVRPEPAARVVVGGGMGRPPSGYRFTADGELEPVPGGPHDPQNRSAQAAASAQGRVAGTAQAEAQADLPRAEANAQDMLNVLNQLERAPGFQYLWGAASYATVPGTAQADALAIWEQVQGKAFLEAFSTLKGGGQITEKEGEKATAAITRLSNRRQSPAGARAAIADLRSVVNAALVRAQRKAGQPAQAPAQPRVRRYNPETGKIE